MELVYDEVESLTNEVQKFKAANCFKINSTRSAYIFFLSGTSSIFMVFAKNSF